MKNQKREKRLKRKRHIKKDVRGTEERPRLSVFRSGKHIYAQLIDDTSGKTVLSANDVKETKGSPLEKANKVGKDIAKLAKAKKITSVIFDRGGYKFHGRVKSLAEGARSGGLKF